MPILDSEISVNKLIVIMQSTPKAASSSVESGHKSNCLFIMREKIYITNQNQYNISTSRQPGLAPTHSLPAGGVIMITHILVTDDNARLWLHCINQPQSSLTVIFSPCLVSFSVCTHNLWLSPIHTQSTYLQILAE